MLLELFELIMPKISIKGSDLIILKQIKLLSCLGPSMKELKTKAVLIQSNLIVLDRVLYLQE